MRDAFVGTILDRRFRIEERIASGGMGAIYRASHVKSSYEVAIKVLHPAMTADPRVVERFRREGATLTALRSPHTVTTYELAEDANGTLFIVMELLRGDSLLDRFRGEGSLPWKWVVAVARAVCDSLAEAHALGVVHRDLKPANIHLEKRDGVDFVKVIDFGVAKLVRGNRIENSGEELTNHNEVIGTYDYLSPEQIIGDSYSGRTDIYQLGVVMYEMITGSRPFGHAMGAALLATILHETPTPPSTRLPGLPPELDRVIMRCIDRDPKARFADVNELAAALDRVAAPRDGRDDIETTRSLKLELTEHEESTAIAPAPTAPVPKPPYATPAFPIPALQPPAPRKPPALPPPVAQRRPPTMPPPPAMTPAPFPVSASLTNMPQSSGRPSHVQIAPSVAPIFATLDGFPAPPPTRPSALEDGRPTYDVASTLAHDRLSRQIVWIGVLVVAIVIGIALAIAL